MSQHHISIIGAGISGLVLGRCLLQRGVSSVLFEREVLRSGPTSTRHAYGITLHPWAYRPLLKYLDLDESTFRRKLAVDGPVGGIGRIDSTAGPVFEEMDASSFRANRHKFEQMLSEGLDLRWEHRLADVKAADSPNGGLDLEFCNGRHLTSSVVVGADGPHSQVRKSISPTTQLTVLPYAVYNGKRRLGRDEFDGKYSAYMDGANVIEHRAHDTLMQIAINDRTSESVSISYTYSRPASRDDALFVPDRPVSGATDIPSALFDEIAGLSGLDGPFREVFNMKAMQTDRLLNWLMRSVHVEGAGLGDAARKGIILMGDAGHAGPILGGQGANAAIKDGIDLAEFILEHKSQHLDEYYISKYDAWKRYVEESESQIAKMHGKSRSNL